MESWRMMPAGMRLKSSLAASSIADPRSVLTLPAFSRATGIPLNAPIPLETYIEYGDWFQRQAVPHVDRTFVTEVSKSDGRFSVRLADGRSLLADRVVIATGVRRFVHVPAFARALPETLVTHTQELTEPRRLQGRSVAVVGAGQSALETGALLAESGVAAEILVRGRQVNWILKKAWSRGLAKKVLYAPTDVGPPGLSWLVHMTRPFGLLPMHTRQVLTDRAVRPAGASWLRSRVDGQVKITTNVEVRMASAGPDRVCLRLSNGEERIVDHLVLGTGYRPRLECLDFLEPALRQRIVQEDHWPVLNRWFECSVPGLHFAGAMASGAFGPIFRHVSGTGVCARRVAQRAS
jgi:thioredoxin reductase